MTGEVGEPLPKFRFSVQIAGGTATFQEVTGLDSQAQVIEYRHGDSPSFHPIGMPGLSKVSNVTMRKGILVSDAGLSSWLNQIAMNTIARQTVVVSLLDEIGSPRMVWTLNNARPIKVTGADLKSDGGEVTIESIDVAYETLVTSVP